PEHPAARESLFCRLDAEPAPRLPPRVVGNAGVPAAVLGLRDVDGTGGDDALEKVDGLANLGRGRVVIRWRRDELVGTVAGDAVPRHADRLARRLEAEPERRRWRTEIRFDGGEDTLLRRVRVGGHE